MPNWCTNVVKIVDGKPSDIEAVYAMLKDTDEPFAVIMPRPEGVDWYDWNNANWGTKWDAGEFQITLHEDGIDMTFMTAWAPAIPVFEHLSDKFPSLQIQHFYEECGMGFEGVAAIHAGSSIDDCRDMPDFGDDEAAAESYLNTPLDERLAIEEDE